MGAQFNNLGTDGEKVHNEGSEVRGETQLQQYPDENSWNNCVKSRAVVHIEHPHKGLQSFRLWITVFFGDWDEQETGCKY